MSRPWGIHTALSAVEEGSLQTYDVKKERKDLYGGRRDFAIVQVPSLPFLMVDGHGDPNTSTGYREGVEALYVASYAVRAVAKERLGKVHTVGPLEGLWSADDLTVFRTRDKSAWDWTLMIVQPDWVSQELVGDALVAARERRGASLDRVGFETYEEGRSVQILHVGSYDDEGPTLERLHGEFLPANGLVPEGRHHEIYLSDPRKVEPARLRTILRSRSARSTPGATLLHVERIGVRELRQQASRYLDKVKAGESVEVTERGQLVALLVPPLPASTDRQRLIATGRLLPAHGPLVLPPRRRAGSPTADVLHDLRADR